MTVSTTASHLHQSQIITPEAVRRTMGSFCSGVVVVTALGADATPVGFTCQSFVSLSLDPPLISISPARTSSTWPVIRESGHFVVNVLAHDHAGLSSAFARSGADKYAGVTWHPSPREIPILEGVSAWVECSLSREYDGGDHTIAIGEVTALGHDEERDPLLYFRGGYPAASWR